MTLNDKSMMAILKLKKENKLSTKVIIDDEEIEGFINKDESMVILGDDLKRFASEQAKRSHIRLSVKPDYASVILSADYLRDILKLCDNGVKIGLSAEKDGNVCIETMNLKLDDFKICVALG